jgi:4-hydroxy-tetrahydrodipicolinate synthase
MIYNNPSNSAAPALDARRVRELYEAGLARAVKSTFPTVHEVHELRAETDEGFRVFYGSFMAPLEALAGGAHGWISGILNVATRDAVALREAVGASDLERARLAWRRIVPIKWLWTRQPLGPLSDLAIYRAILRLRGFEPGRSRAPVRDLDADQLARLERMLDEAGLLGAAGASVGPAARA